MNNNWTTTNWPFLIRVLCCLRMLILRVNYCDGLEKARQSDCTLRGGPAVVKEASLRSASLGGLSDANIQVWRGEPNTGSLVSPNTYIEAVVNADLRFTIFSSLSSAVPFYGYLIRIAGADSHSNFEPFFVGDSRNLGVVSFCSALGFRVSAMYGRFRKTLALNVKHYSYDLDVASGFRRCRNCPTTFHGFRHIRVAFYEE